MASTRRTGRLQPLIPHQPASLLVNEIELIVCEHVWIRGHGNRTAFLAEYSIQMNTLLTSKCMVMMEQAMKLLTCENGVGPSDLTFGIADVKLAQAELLSKTRILV
jgi:hypothetical protein